MPFNQWSRAGACAAQIGLRSHWHHQNHDPDAQAPLESHETLVPMRSSAPKARFHSVGHEANLHDQLQLNGYRVDLGPWEAPDQPHNPDQPHKVGLVLLASRVV
jgi:hypothetical protein